MATVAFKPALLVVDMQEDFCPPNGSLAVEGGRDIAPGINRLLELPFAVKAASADWHTEDHASFANNHPGPNNEAFKHKAVMTNPNKPGETKESMLWPAHCIQDTPGAAFIPELHSDRITQIVRKGLDTRVEMYSAFNDIFGNKSGYDFDLADSLRQQNVTHLYVCGLTGDCCVFESALGARREGFEVFVLGDLTRSVSADDYAGAVRDMKAAGIVMAESSGPEVSRVEQLGEAA